MKIFISQPMNGLTTEQIISNRNIIISKINKVLKDDFEIIDSLLYDPVPSEIKHEGVYYLGKSIELMATADVAYFAEGWDKTRGCIIEETIARKYGITCIYFEDV